MNRTESGAFMLDINDNTVDPGHGHVSASTSDAASTSASTVTVDMDAPMTKKRNRSVSELRTEKIKRVNRATMEYDRLLGLRNRLDVRLTACKQREATVTADLERHDAKHTIG